HCPRSRFGGGDLRPHRDSSPRRDRRVWHDRTDLREPTARIHAEVDGGDPTIAARKRATANENGSSSINLSVIQVPGKTLRGAVRGSDAVPLASLIVSTETNAGETEVSAGA